MNLFLKRLFDFLVSIVLLVLLIPFFIVISLAIIIESFGNPFFLQKRVGYKMRVFKIVKFRTMILNAESVGSGVFTNASDTRITKVGSFLRRYSLDELPQIFNVLVGTMSFIGPRPPVTYFPYKIDAYPKEFIRRFDMKSGITGLAQISGRTNLTWEERFVLDIQYIEGYSIWKDVKIIVSTLGKVFKSERVYPTDEFIKSHHKLKE